MSQVSNIRICSPSEIFPRADIQGESREARLVTECQFGDHDRIYTVPTPQIHYRRHGFSDEPEEITQPLAPALSHWFNHETHHRGQVHALLTGLSGRAPQLDLAFYQRLAIMERKRSAQP